ncbi:transposase [Actinomadura gamaensis]|uniref:Transposase n=1 Tax=Actinomadura gamaensis TaxID=1763541 RepID=A0ABV9U988_9ACTN
MSARRRYPSDLSDARWALIEPVLTAWRADRLATALYFGRPPEHDLRTLMDAILYVDRTGIPWRYLPHDHPPWQTVYAHFAKWQKRWRVHPAQWTTARASPPTGRAPEPAQHLSRPARAKP